MEQKNILSKKKHVGKDILHFALLIVGAIVLAVIFRIFFFTSFRIPTPSMEPTIVAGDHIMVNKSIPGARIFKDFNFIETGKRPNIYRCKGIRNIKRNDVLVFNFPYYDWNRLNFDMNTYYVKRCVAIPGDTFYIDNGIYKVKNSTCILGHYHNQQQWVASENLSSYYSFPYDTKLNWTMLNFGPLYIPKKGDCLPIGTQNISLYRRLIEYETAGEVEIRKDSIFLNGIHMTHYRFDTNYYFMTGDLVSDSQDSRYWGIVPEDHIVGKAAFVWKSKDGHTKKMRWNRVFKQIK
ncbi:signal peptidase I [Paludibacter sp. 221]|uniref:signal peptidase I n=1 Tax=Paludibacter sp. 221 TaxID=2302939 RepID=UPI0013D1A758|nr:signal peptidase I [Paludibacter sp. 221]NDV46574.1 signal peptidase I [Paludibacter sp. 221]